MMATVLYVGSSVLTVGSSKATEPQASGQPGEGSTPTPAQTPPAPTLPAPTAAQMHAGKAFFVRGQQLYHDGKYGAAWVEFSSAYEITQSPDLILNMARCKEKMNHPLEATEHYRQFLRLRPDDPEAPQIREQITRLEQQMNSANAATAPAQAPTPTPAPSSQRPFPIIGTALAGGAALFILLGGISIGVGKSRYDDLSKTCKPACSDDQVQGARTPYNAGYAMFGLAAVSAVAAAVVIPYQLGLFSGGVKAPEPKTSLLIGPGSLFVVGRF